MTTNDYAQQTMTTRNAWRRRYLLRRVPRLPPAAALCPTLRYYSLRHTVIAALPRQLTRHRKSIHGLLRLSLSRSTDLDTLKETLPGKKGFPPSFFYVFLKNSGYHNYHNFPPRHSCRRSLPAAAGSWQRKHARATSLHAVSALAAPPAALSGNKEGGKEGDPPSFFYVFLKNSGYHN